MSRNPSTSDDPAPSGGVLRKHLTERFTQVPNDTIRDSRLSFRAVGVLVHILSLPDGARIGARALTPAHKEGREAVAAALRELAACGYYHAAKEHVDGRMVTIITVADEPVLRGRVPGAQETGTRKPGPQERTLTTEHQHLSLVQPDGSTDDDGTDGAALIRGLPFPTQAAIRGGAPYPEPFAAFWTAYPRKIGKAQAYRAWIARLQEGRKAGVTIERRTAMMVVCAQNYARSVQGRDLQHVKHPATFVGPDEHWKEYATTAAPDAAQRTTTTDARRGSEHLWD